MSAAKSSSRSQSGSHSTRSWLLAHALHFGVAVSVLAHTVMALTGFIAPSSGPRIERDQGLKVVLVNARHQRAPKDPQALAQANLDGGGDASDAKQMPSSPLPAQDSHRDGDALVEARQKLQQLEAAQRELLTRAQGSGLQINADRKTRDGENLPDVPTERGGLDLQNASAIARQAAIVEKALNDYASRPKKGFVSPRTREYRLAQYGEDWRIKVQRVGELNFPRGTKGSLYGSVLIAVEILPDGRVLSAEVVRPDKNPKINEAALRIIKMASPYAPFPPDIRRDYDVLVITRTMSFTREDIAVSAEGS
jgi:periplasmic protein TonB